MTVKSPEALNLIPMAFSLLEENLCSYNIHNHMSVMAEESLTKQYCTIIQNTVISRPRYAARMAYQTTGLGVMRVGKGLRDRQG